MDAIYLVRNGQQVGPFTRAQIDAMLASGETTRDTMAWYDGLPNWTALGTILGPVSVSAAPPAPTPLAPFAATAVTSDATGYTTDQLRHLGKCQNQLMLAFLISIIFNIIAKVADLGHAGLMMDILIFFAALGVVGFAMYATVRLATALRYGIFGIVLLCLGLLIPCVSLIILLFLTAQSSKVLKAAGIKIGLMGAKVDDVKS